MFAILSAAKMRSTALLEDFDSLASCISVRLHDYYYFSTAFPVSFVMLYPHEVLSLFRLRLWYISVT